MLTDLPLFWVLVLLVPLVSVTILYTISFSREPEPEDGREDP